MRILEIMGYVLFGSGAGFLLYALFGQTQPYEFWVAAIQVAIGLALIFYSRHNRGSRPHTSRRDQRK